MTILEQMNNKYNKINGNNKHILKWWQSGLQLCHQRRKIKCSKTLHTPEKEQKWYKQQWNKSTTKIEQDTKLQASLWKPTNEPQIKMMVSEERSNNGKDIYKRTNEISISKHQIKEDSQITKSKKENLKLNPIWRIEQSIVTRSKKTGEEINNIKIEKK